MRDAGAVHAAVLVGEVRRAGAGIDPRVPNGQTIGGRSLTSFQVYG
jgi:hypothetical protein